MLLAGCEEKTEYKIKRLYFKGNTALRAAELGFKRGEKITVIKKFGSGGGVLLLNYSFLAAGKEIFYSVEVEN
ncbi:MAG: ferrous iron transport protein A [Clostridia bacterium]|nr:ferrous iron transport protein A [Clostridia bacterium]